MYESEYMKKSEKELKKISNSINELVESEGEQELIPTLEQMKDSLSEYDPDNVD